MTARYETRDGVAIVSLDNPPVNGLGLATRTGIVEGVDRAQKDPAVTAIRVTGTGLFDRILDGDLLGGAIAFARDVATRPGPHPKVRDWKIEHPNAEGFIGFARTAVATVSRNFPAPLKCVDAIEAAVKKSFKEG